MPKLAALTVSVGVLAVLATWLFSLSFATALNLQIWQAFIAWGCHFHCGGKFPGYRNATVCMIFGALVGMAAVMLAGQLGRPHRALHVLHARDLRADALVLE